MQITSQYEYIYVLNNQYTMCPLTSTKEVML